MRLPDKHSGLLKLYCPANSKNEHSESGLPARTHISRFARDFRVQDLFFYAQGQHCAREPLNVNTIWGIHKTIRLPTSLIKISDHHLSPPYSFLHMFQQSEMKTTFCHYPEPQNKRTPPFPPRHPNILMAKCGTGRVNHKTRPKSSPGVQCVFEWRVSERVHSANLIQAVWAPGQTSITASLSRLVQ